MAELDPFEQLAEALEVTKLEAEVERRGNALDQAMNDQVIELGKHALEGGLTSTGLVDLIWKVALRHKSLADTVGYANLQRPEHFDYRASWGKENLFDIGSNRVSIAPDIVIALRHRSLDSALSHRFWRTFSEEGLSFTLDEYVCPMTALIAGYTPEGEKFFGRSLIDTELSSPDPEFNELWGKELPGFVSAIEWRNRYEQRRFGYEGLLPDADFSERNIIVGAGFALQFDQLLDEVESHV